MIDDLKLALATAWDNEMDAIAGKVSVHLRTLDGGVAGRRDDVPHYAASTFKLAAAVAAMAATLDDRLDLNGQIDVHSRFPSGAGGSFALHQSDDQDDPTWERLGGTLPVATLMERMLVDSSNIATNLLVEAIGLDAVRRAIVSAGADGMAVQRLIGDDPADASGLTNVVTARALAQLLAALAAGSLLPAKETAALIGLAARQTYRRLVPAGLPDGTWSAGKAGWNDAVKHDVALVRPPGVPGYILAVCTTTGLSAPAECLVAQLSAVTWKHWTRWHAS